MIEKSYFDKMPSGEDIFSYKLTNTSGSSVKILTLGGRINEINVPDKNGNFADVVCGFDNANDYLNDSAYQGALIGRFGNRIKDAKFTLDGVEYKLFVNNGKNHLHGGKIGFDKRLWNARSWQIGGDMFLELSLFSADMEEGYPGNLNVVVLYTFNEENVLSINYKATTDKKTVINLTNHSYFNLGGYGSGDIMSHKLWLDADKITETDSDLIPTGKELDIAGTAFDFKVEKLIGKDIDADDINIKNGQGYDHNYVLNTNGEVKLFATLTDTKTGRVMKAYTNQPCVQIYAGNCINPTDPPFKNGIKQVKRCGICFETQHAPDAPNNPSFVSCELKPGELYNYTTVFKFE